LRVVVLPPPFPGQLPDDASAPETAVKSRVEALTAFLGVEAFAALPAESGLVFQADPERLPVRMVPALHRLFLTAPSYPNGLSPVKGFVSRPFSLRPGPMICPTRQN
jgi:hypothetical protein